MKPVNIHEAKTHLSRLIERVEAGEEIIIAKAGRPAARLVPIEKAFNPIKIGGMKSKVLMPDDFNTMFEDEIAAMFGARETPSARRVKK